MKHETSFENFRDGRKVFMHFSQNCSESKAIIVLIHGLGEHSGRYLDMADFFTENCIDFLAPDTFGHGQTSGKQGHSRKMDDYLELIDFTIKKAKTLKPDVPIFLYGHSMGGALVLKYLFKYQPVIQGVIASAPAIKPGFEVSKSMLLIGKIGQIFSPSLTQSNSLDLNNLSHNKEVKKAYLNDPFVHDRISAEVGMGLLNYGNWIAKQKEAPSSPLLIMHGSEDKLTNFEASKSFAAQLPGDVTWKPWEGLYHESHNETNKEEVLNCTLDWIKSKL
jgi:acylglycerol lipase